MNTHRLRPRALFSAALLALCLMAVGASGAQAAKVKVTGGTTTITPSAATTQFLTANGIAVTALVPAILLMNRAARWESRRSAVTELSPLRTTWLRRATRTPSKRVTQTRT
jgi:hypothetical protein